MDALRAFCEEVFAYRDLLRDVLLASGVSAVRACGGDGAPPSNF
jgi:hypothetical protein